MKVYIKRFDKVLPLPTIIDKGDWVDLYVAKDTPCIHPTVGPRKRKMIHGVNYSTRDIVFNNYFIPLNVAMKLPKGFEAVILPRSSTYNKFGIILANSQGVIDNSYCGNNDQWLFNAIAFRDTMICRGNRIAQFRIQLSQKATFWQKLKWLFCSKIEFVEVDNLSDNNRGGFGSTGN